MLTLGKNIFFIKTVPIETMHILLKEITLNWYAIYKVICSLFEKHSNLRGLEQWRGHLVRELRLGLLSMVRYYSMQWL